MREFHRDHHEDDRLSAFLDDELDERDALVVTRHLASCDRCLAELEETRAARSMLRGLPNLDPPPTLFHEVSTLALADGSHLGRGVRLLAAALATSVAVGLTAFAAGGESDGTVSPPIDVFVVDHVSRVGGGPVLTPIDLGSASP
jgi:anti-sigma factor RsiW